MRTDPGVRESSGAGCGDAAATTRILRGRAAATTWMVRGDGVGRRYPFLAARDRAGRDRCFAACLEDVSALQALIAQKEAALVALWAVLKFHCTVFRADRGDAAGRDVDIPNPT